MAWDHIGEVAALGTACCWTVTSMAFESAGKRVGSLSVNLIRLCMALAFLTVWGWARRDMLLPLDASPETWGWLALSGLIGFTVGDLLLFQAFVVIGSRLSMLLMALVPPFTALVGRAMLGEQLAPLDWLGMGLTVGGVGWVILERRPAGDGERRRVPLSGLLLGAGGAAGQAVGLVLSKLGMGDYDPFAATQIRVAAGCVGFGVLFVFIRHWPRVIAALGDGKAMAGITAGAVFGPFLGVSLSLVAVQHTEAGVAATIMALVPVLIIPPTIFVKKERVSARAALGAAVAVSGAAVLFL